MARFQVRSGRRRGIYGIPCLQSRLQVAVIIIIVFIISVSIKILQPEFSSDTRIESLNLGDSIKHNAMPDGNLVVNHIDFAPQEVHLDIDGPMNIAQRTENARDKLIEKYRVNISTSKHSLQSLWSTAADWVQAREILPERATELGAILHAMATAPITAVDVGYKGTQLKLSMELQDKQSVVFKPMWYKRDFIIQGEPYAGRDRHNAEVAAFHLSRILGLRRVPLAVGRKVNLKQEVIPVASQALLNTFYKDNNNTCFYGKCYYCRPTEGVCAEGEVMEGTVILWLPAKFILNTTHHPWARKYRANVRAKWETDDNYCKAVKQLPLYKTHDYRLLDIIDTAIFDYLIGNADRHHYETFSNVDKGMLVILDNGKSFGNPFQDERSILAPLYQCCIVRYSTRENLRILQESLLSSVLREVLRSDPIYPVLTDSHFEALDRRVATVLQEIETCISTNGLNSIILDDR
ncbi:glycosaminoglycan xylosylkinase-like [Pomacea canaliculata]|uniref:glycosaminoglycan xylosylkinase-like n=1 Tax=Pomacea canaliculata TaxID=400727 RepID=UPI000D73D8F7|nr:glycosaminoglycan xylosylkinase-like [Pomacea canaliculata]